MDKIRENLIKIAKEKIAKSQNRTIESRAKTLKTQNRTVKSRAKKQNSPSRAIKHKETEKIYFPHEPIGYFGVTRPREARLATKNEQELTQKFLNDLENLKRTKKYKFEDFLREANITNKRNINK